MSVSGRACKTSKRRSQAEMELPFNCHYSVVRFYRTTQLFVFKGVFGAGEEIRTPDQRLGKPMRYHCATPAQIVVNGILDRGQKSSQGKRGLCDFLHSWILIHEYVYCKTPPHPSPLLLHAGEGI